MSKEKKTHTKILHSIILHVIILFVAAIITTGVLTYLSERNMSYDNVTMQTEYYASEIATETKMAIMEYPAYQWLIKNWYYNFENLEVEYDVNFRGNSLTLEKCKLFSQRHPDLQLKYLDTAQCEALPINDQYLYAEIVYSWLTTRINQIKQTYNVDFLFCVVTESPYDRQFFLFSGAEPGTVRGTNYLEVYPLGHTVTVGESQTEAMREAIVSTNHLADAGSYVDYYTLLCTFDTHKVMIGLTYDLSAIHSSIDRQTITGTSLAIIHQIILSVIVLSLIILLILGPVKRVQNSIRMYKETKNSEKVIEDLEKNKMKNEIGELADDTSEMIREIEQHMEQIKAITSEKERISTELSLATRIQASMLPSIFPPFPERKEFDIYASMDPAKEVGGDFYDFFLIDDDHLGLVIADVSGKGVPAALFMMVSKILIKNQATSGKSPGEVLEAVNRQICSNNREEMFVTVWLGILEISTGKLTAANAGHEYPTIKRPDGEFEIIKDKHGLVIGAMDIAKYKEYELMLEPGTKVFVYTDGVPEATNSEKILFGTDRMIDALRTSDVTSGTKSVLDSVRAAVDDFVKDAEQFDDLTMLCLEYMGPQ